MPSFSEARSVYTQSAWFRGRTWQQAQFATAVPAPTISFSPAWLCSFSPRFFSDSRVPIISLGCFVLRDRKSTRLNSSHVKISYAVFCLKKKKRHKDEFL